MATEARADRGPDRIQDQDVADPPRDLLADPEVDHVVTVRAEAVARVTVAEAEASLILAHRPDRTAEARALPPAIRNPSPLPVLALSPQAD